MGQCVACRRAFASSQQRLSKSSSSRPSGALLSTSIGRRPTRAVQAARRNALPTTLSAPNEYQVHGLFKMESGDRAFPDTYNFTLAQLQAAGLSKALLQEKLLEFSQLLKLECDKELGELDEPEEQPDQQPEGQPEGQPP